MSKEFTSVQGGLSGAERDLRSAEALCMLPPLLASPENEADRKGPSRLGMSPAEGRPFSPQGGHNRWQL